MDRNQRDKRPPPPPPPPPSRGAPSHQCHRGGNKRHKNKNHYYQQQGRGGGGGGNYPSHPGNYGIGTGSGNFHSPQGQVRRDHHHSAPPPYQTSSNAAASFETSRHGHHDHRSSQYPRQPRNNQKQQYSNTDNSHQSASRRPVKIEQNNNNNSEAAAIPPVETASGGSGQFISSNSIKKEENVTGLSLPSADSPDPSAANGADVTVSSSTASTRNLGFQDDRIAALCEIIPLEKQAWQSELHFPIVYHSAEYNWQQRQELARATAEQQALAAAKPRPFKLVKTDSDDDSDYDDDDDDDEFDPKQDYPIKVTQAFCRALGTFVPMTACFFAEGEKELCYCPCSRKSGVPKWRLEKVWKAAGYEQESDIFISDIQCAVNKFYPTNFIKHLESKNDIFHKLTLTFMKTLFADFYCNGLNHYAFYNRNSAEVSSL